MGGVKFCLVPADKCSVGAHTKKVDVQDSHVYINAGRNAAFTDPHVPSLAFGSVLPELLGELHPREEWLRIFQGFLDEVAPEPLAGTLITPRKRKYRYLPDNGEAQDTESPLSFFSSSDVDQPEFGKTLFTALQKLDHRFSEFQRAVGDDVDSLFAKLQDIKAGMGVKPTTLPLEGFNDDCVTLWESMTMLSGLIWDPNKMHQLETTIQTLGSTSTTLTNKVCLLETGQGELSELSQLLSFEQDQINQGRNAKHIHNF